MQYRLIAFDIDGTLTPSKSPLERDMSEHLSRLLRRYKVAAISGAGYPQFEKQFLSNLKCSDEELRNLFLLPTDGTAFCVYETSWKCEYDKPFSEEETEEVKRAVEEAWVESGLEMPQEIFGERVENRGAQVSFSALGQDAPLELKKVWDPDHAKRAKLLKILKDKLPSYSAHIGGTTTIDINRAGIDKAYGLTKLMERLRLEKKDILYLGDEVFEGGNDEPALKLGLDTKQVSGPAETAEVISELLM